MGGVAQRSLPVSRSKAAAYGPLQVWPAGQPRAAWVRETDTNTAWPESAGAAAPLRGFLHLRRACRFFFFLCDLAVWAFLPFALPLARLRLAFRCTQEAARFFFAFF